MKTNLRLLISFLALSFFNAGAQNMDLWHDGVQRNLRLHFPPAYNGSVPMPLVFNMHGYGSNAAQQELYCQMNQTADAEGFIVAYPNGLNTQWNSGFAGVYGTGTDDVGFISSAIDTIATQYNIDLTRVYACGMSNGGYQSYRLACELENRIAAIASVTGLLTDSTAFYCNLSRKVPVMQIHGTADPTVNYNGFAGSLGAEQTISFWLNGNQCAITNDTTYITDSNTSDNCTVQLIRYADCADGAEVLFYKVIDGGHTWPSGLFDIGSGPTNRDINANQEIWNFFKRFTLNGPVSAIQNPEMDKIKIYPNPFSDQLTVSGNEGFQLAEIFQYDGRLVARQDMLANVQTISAVSLAPGAYFIRLSHPGGQTIRQLLKTAQ